MIATNEQIAATLIWFINNRSKNISRLIHEAIENPEKNNNNMQLQIASNFEAMYYFISMYRKILPNKEIPLNG